MAIPPFPSQDLAKLVLGYLAEEQLMTAYDEFLQASPYLDAMRNEYDRIFMTSLKSILAEYRAVKIYVETCKPFLLRKKLFQCANLLEIVKFLVNHLDGNKLSTQEVGDDISLEKTRSTNTVKSSACEVCNSLKLSSCICKTKQNHQKMLNALPVINQDETSSMDSVETTSLADLPGSHIKNRKKPLKLLDKTCTLTQSYSHCASNEQSSKQSSGTTSNHSQCNSSVPIVETMPKPIQINLESMELGPHVTQSKQKLDDLNNDLSTVCKKFAVRDKKEKKPKRSNKKGSTCTSFQDFASGVKGGEIQKGIAPDSSTSENINCVSHQNTKKCENVKGTPKPQLYLKIEACRNKLTSQDNEVMNTINNYPYMKIRPADQKVKILSNVKVDKAYKNIENKITALTNNATSTPLMQMQTIFINGTPAYRAQHIQEHQQTYSKDEIMAMPTIIVVPTSGGQQSIPQAQSVTSLSASTTTTQINPTGKHLSPLIIDISPPAENINTNESNLSKETSKKANDIGLVKTVDVATHFKNSSVPKDIVTSLAETSTPLIIPINRKSSSTPRRTSHIRVLDFTTPRRILDETINEQASNENCDSPIEVIPTENFITETRIVNDVTDEKSVKKQGDSYGSILSDKQPDKKEKSRVPLKASWDSKLRVMIASNNEVCNSTPRANNSKNKNSNNTNDARYKETKKLRKTKKIKNKEVIDDNKSEQVDKTEVVQIKPTIHIKSGSDRTTIPTYVDKKECEEKQSKLTGEERIHTPELDRITLQNVIGAKLNISELLETPYKQVLYDIQMETPRCLGLDLPGEPMSDIKIMNIPTPRFFDSPQIISATPSYSSRPTDYSSGGSYYKPDDQDFIPSDMKCIVTSKKEDVKGEMIKDNSSHNKKKPRPVRKCAKNVSYYNSSKMKDSDDKTDAASSCSESANTNSIDSKSEKENSKVVKDNLIDISESKTEKSKSSRKRKSPVIKEKPKTFMKIKPRRVTPIKDSLSARIRKKTLQTTSPKLQRKGASSKEKNIHVTPAVTCVPTKSRRKSSTPRKLHCSKTFNSSSVHDSAQVNKITNRPRDTNSMSTQDSDVDQLALRWSDDGSPELKILEEQTNVANDSEDISKIQEYLDTTVLNPLKENEGVFQNDLIKRGFDIETARIIERDLLDTPPQNDINRTVIEQPTKSAGLTNDTLENTITNESQFVQCDDGNDEIELSLHECNEETNNFVVFEYNDTKETSGGSLITLKDKFSMEVCIDDDLTIRLRATPFSLLYDFNQTNEEKGSNTKETEEAVKSILGMDTLYTPLKSSIKDQVYNIFDSTLTSLDTPLKVNSPKKAVPEFTVNAIVIEEEEPEMHEKVVIPKRKRNQSDGSEESMKDNKRGKPDAQYMLSSANIQNIDIETVLKKLHGP